MHHKTQILLHGHLFENSNDTLTKLVILTTLKFNLNDS